MKTVGLIGGMSWESSNEYYRLLNEGVHQRLGGVHSARSVMVSVDFADIEVLQREGRWEEATQAMVRAAQALERAGAECIVLCTNTMHKSAGAITGLTRIPFLHIADATAQRIRAAGLHTVGLLGTRFTMEEAFYKNRLVDKFGLQVLIPDPEQRETVHRVIYDELVLGKINSSSKKQYVNIIKSLVSQGAEGIILGCTEIGMLIQAKDSPVPLFDTTRIHAEAAVEFALSG
jgi:aspartate racemase